MFNVCPNCGEYSVEKSIDTSGPYAVCPHCHYAHPFLLQPLFLIGGASGTGKTTVGLSLVSILNECVVLEQDILWDCDRGTNSGLPLPYFLSLPALFSEEAQQLNGSIGSPRISERTIRTPT